MIKVVAYARFSSSGQREESIDAQVRAIKKYCQENQYELIKIYKDLAISGRTDDRPEFQKMIKDSKKRQFKYVVVHKLDRFSRDRYDSAIYKRKLKLNGVKILSVLENLGDTPEAIIMESLLEGMSEYYSANLSREVTKGMKENALKAYFNGGHVPLGYDIVDKKYVVNEYEAKAIRLLFDLYDKGYKYADISRALESKGYRNKKGNPFKIETLKGFLKRELYKGDYKYRLHTGEIIYLPDAVPAIVSKELFDRVQDKMADKSFRGSKKSDRIYLLSGILYHEDGGEMVGVSGTGKTGKVFYYYRCKKCKIYKRADKLESMIVQMFKDVLFHKDNIELIIDSTYQNLLNSEDRKSVLEIENKIKQNENAIDKLINALIDSETSSVPITKKINSLEKQNENLKYELVGLKSKTEVTREEVSDFIYAQKNKLDFDRLALKNMLFAFIDNIKVGQTQITVNLKNMDLTDVETCSSNLPNGVP